VDKTEIEEMPEGKTSEEIDAIIMEDEEEEKPENSDESIAKEVLDEIDDDTDDDSPAEEPESSETEEAEEEEPEVDPKDAVIGDFRRRLRDKELEAARLQGQLEARKEFQATKTEPEKSPLQIAMEEEGVDHPDDLAKPFSVLMEQQKWEKERDAALATTQAAESSKAAASRALSEAMAGDFSAEKLGAGLDFDSVTAMGDKYLDEADLMKIDIIGQKHGVNAAIKKTYDLCKDAILNANNQDSKTLQAFIDWKGKSQPKPKKKLKTSEDVDDLTTEDDDKGEADDKNSNLYLRVFGKDAV
jgi:hypothetical protein